MEDQSPEESRAEQTGTLRRPILKGVLSSPLFVPLAMSSNAVAQEGSGTNSFSHDFEDQSLEDYVAVYGQKSDWSIESALDGYAAYSSIPQGNSFLKLDPDQYTWSGDRSASIDFKSDTSNWKKNAHLLFEDGDSTWIVGAHVQGDAILLMSDEGTTGDWQGIEKVDHNIADGDRHTLASEITGSTFSISLDGQEVLTSDVGSTPGTGSIGFGLHGDIEVGAWFDNFRVSSMRSCNKTGAKIPQDGFNVDSRTYSLGDVVTAQVTVENTGDCKHEFFVGFTVFDPNGNSHDNNGSTGHSVTVASGESTTTTVEWTVEEEAAAGPYNAATSVWKESDPSNLETRYDSATQEKAFRINNGRSGQGKSIATDRYYKAIGRDLQTLDDVWSVPPRELLRENWAKQLMNSSLSVLKPGFADVLPGPTGDIKDLVELLATTVDIMEATELERARQHIRLWGAGTSDIDNYYNTLGLDPSSRKVTSQPYYALYEVLIRDLLGVLNDETAEETLKQHAETVSQVIEGPILISLNGENQNQHEEALIANLRLLNNLSKAIVNVVNRSTSES